MKTKSCRKCLVTKPVSEFYVHRGTHGPKDGLQAYCKQCCVKSAMERAKTPAGKRYYREWKSRWFTTEKGKASARRTAKKYRKRNPLKVKVHKFTNLAIDLGILIKPEACSVCGVAPKKWRNGHSSLQAHHLDYSKPLEVVWVCNHCHKKLTHGEKYVPVEN